MNEDSIELMQQSRGGVQESSSSDIPSIPLTETLRGIKLTVAYDGTQYQGWQAQTGGRTVQDEVQRIASRIAGEKVTLHASGRTDAGVHALGQIVSFQTHAAHPPEI